MQATLRSKLSYPEGRSNTRNVRFLSDTSQKTLFFMFITSCYHPSGLAGIEFVGEMLFFTCLLIQNTTEHKTTPITSCIMICKGLLKYDKIFNLLKEENLSTNTFQINSNVRKLPASTSEYRKESRWSICIGLLSTLHTHTI